jgi:hypothetical protein
VPIPETQLDTWSKKGADAQSRDTYATVKGALEDRNAPYYPRIYTSLLQGSYANDTNVFRDSDVDVVMRLDSTFYHDAITLPTEQFTAFNSAYPNSDYGLKEFKKEVADWLTHHFGNSVRVGSKAILIPGNGTRRDCDILACAAYRYYYRYTGTENSYANGIMFYCRDGSQIVNFPEQHSANCTTKHQNTNSWFKPTVRIYKNMRNYMVDRGMLQDGVAPSYFIEGMLYNAPDENFKGSWEDTFVNTFNFINSADRSTFKCANGIHSLLADNSHVSWPPGDCSTFLDALRGLWTNWR